MQPTTTRRVASHWRWISGVIALALTAALGLLVVLRESPLELDAGWMSDILARRNPELQVLALLMDRLGGGIVAIFVVPLGTVALLLVARRPWGALFSISCSPAPARRTSSSSPTSARSRRVMSRTRRLSRRRSCCSSV